MYKLRKAIEAELGGKIIPRKSQSKQGALIFPAAAAFLLCFAALLELEGKRISKLLQSARSMLAERFMKASSSVPIT